LVGTLAALCYGNSRAKAIKSPTTTTGRLRISVATIGCDNAVRDDASHRKLASGGSLYARRIRSPRESPGKNHVADQMTFQVAWINGRQLEAGMLDRFKSDL
jgi:hypothetical protein